MLPKIDYGALDAAETRTVAVRALEQLKVEDIITVLKQVLNGDDRQEVIAQLEDE
jgi:flagellin-specific chaperone FliS